MTIPSIQRLGRVVAFGWELFNMRLPAGTQYWVRIAAVTPRDRLPIRTLWTKGRITSTAPGISDRVPGMLSSELPETPVGNHMLEAVEETEWWCLNRQYSKDGTLPVIGKIVLAAGESAAVPAGTRFFVCHGSGMLGELPVVVGYSELTTSPDVLTTSSGLICMTFDRDAR